MARYHAPVTLEMVEARIIWADRLGIALWLLTGGLFGLVYLVWGDPGAFKAFETVTGLFSFAVWFICRVIDFAGTGRIR